jgi:uncharacterized membrane protein
MSSAAEQHVLGWPLPAAVVARTESIRRRVAIFISAGTRGDVWTGNWGNLREHYKESRCSYNCGMLALRYLYVLALVVWLGGMVVLGAIVAPSTFQVLQASAPAGGRALAGELFGEILARFHYVAYAAGGALFVSLAAMAILGPRPRAFAVRLLLVTAMLLVALYSGIIVLGSIDALQLAVGGLPSQLPADDARRLQFDALHDLSTRLMMVNVAGALALLYWEARDSDR